MIIIVILVITTTINNDDTADDVDILTISTTTTSDNNNKINTNDNSNGKNNTQAEGERKRRNPAREPAGYFPIPINHTGLEAKSHKSRNVSAWRLPLRNGVGSSRFVADPVPSGRIGCGIYYIDAIITNTLGELSGFTSSGFAIVIIVSRR